VANNRPEFLESGTVYVAVVLTHDCATEPWRNLVKAGEVENAAYRVARWNCAG